MQKKSNGYLRRVITVICALALIVACFPYTFTFAETPDRLVDANLEAYYSFEDAAQVGKDFSGKENHLTTLWGYSPTAAESGSGELALGQAAKFAAQSSLSPAGSVYDTKDFLDNMDTYTLSMFFQNTEACAGGALFNNKFWGEDGVLLTVNKWADPAATGQVEMYLDYNYIDTAGVTQTYHGCVKFMPQGANGADTAWHHIALAVDIPNHTIALYFDGEKVHENSDMSALLVSCQKYPLTFGARVDPQWPSGDLAYDGNLDEIRIYNFTANAEEVRRLAINKPEKEEEPEEPVDRLVDANLEAYYSFEDAAQVGKDFSGKDRHLTTYWGYTPTTFTADSGELNLGTAGKFASQSTLTPVGAVFNTRDFLDDLDTYTLSMFFQNTADGTGGILFNNKFWGEHGVQIAMNRWGDPAATGQMELYLDYYYLDTAGNPQNYHQCVKFMAEGTNGADTAWHHLALVVDKPNHTIALYYDGEKIHENSNMSQLLADCQQYAFTFGALVDVQWPDGNSPYSGNLDEIRIYGFTANAEEVAKLAANKLVPDEPEIPDVPEVPEEPDVDRISDSNLEAYYSFEDIIGKDHSGNNHHLMTYWGYNPVAFESNSGALNLGVAGKFASQSTLTPKGSAFNSRDFLDDMDTYTLSMFFQNTADGTGGILFNNKFWGEHGVQIAMNRWADSAATGQMELYLDYYYLDTAGNPQNYHGCVKFIPEGENGADTAWHHLALAVDKPNHTIRLYYDGEKIYENSDMSALLADCQQYPFTIGALVDIQWPVGDSPYSGNLDEIRIYNFAAYTKEAARLAVNDVAEEKPEDDWMISKEPVTDKYDLYTYTLPYWEGDTVYNELMLVLKNADGSVPVKSLLYPTTEILCVRSSDLSVVYEEGKDYILQDGKLYFPMGSSIPMMDHSTYYPSEYTEGASFGATGGGYILYTEQLQRYQISISYKHSGTWNGTIPSYQGSYISKTMEKLENKEAMKIVVYGDSISQGWCASGYQLEAPYADPWATMVTKMLRATYEYNDITLVNSALAGTDSAWGASNENLIPRVVDQNPDLVILHFGANDGHRSLDEFNANLQKIIDTVRQANPNAEFLLVSPMLLNREVEWLATGNEDIFQDEMVKLQQTNTGVGVVRMTDISRIYLENKDYYDASGNNVNHPNDSMVRLYAQSVLAAFLGEVDTAALEDQIKNAEVLSEGRYTSATWERMLAALENAKNARTSQDQNIIDQAVASLKNAIETLEKVNRLTQENLLGYYSFEDPNFLGRDLSGKENHLAHGFWGDPVLQTSGKGGSAALFGGTSVMVPTIRDVNKPDFLDESDAYTVSLFFAMAEGSTDGTLFNNKNWANEGVKITTHTWVDPEAVGQVEIFLDYAYRDENGNLKNYHQVVYFMPAADGGGIDTSWHHIVLTVDAQRGVRFFFDGLEQNVQPAEKVSSYELGCGKYTASFGGSYDDEYGNAQETFNGSLDEIRIYNFAADADEAVSMAQIGASVLAAQIARTEGLNKDRYTAESWAVLVQALEDANKVISGQDQEQIDRAAEILKNAIDNLKMLNWLTLDRLMAYYAFEDKQDMGKDYSGNGNHLDHGFWGDIVTPAPSGAPLGGTSGRVLGASVMTLRNRGAYQKDFLDNMDTYTLSLFFRMAEGSTGGTLFSNKNWAEEGVKITTHTWVDPEAVGQVEIYLDYTYRDETGELKNYHQVIHFMQAAQGGGIDTSWHNIVLVVDQENGIRFFFDGQEKDTNPGEKVSEYVLSCQKYTMSFGGAYDDEYINAQEPFSGWLDEICIYNFAAEAEEAAILAKNGNKKPHVSVTKPAEENNCLTLAGKTESGLGVQLGIPREAVPAGVTLQVSDGAKEKLEALYGEVICLDVSLLNGDKTLTELQEYANLIISGISDWSGYRLFRVNGETLEEIDFYTDMQGNAGVYTRSIGTLVFIEADKLQDSGNTDEPPVEQPTEPTEPDTQPAESTKPDTQPAEPPAANEGGSGILIWVIAAVVLAAAVVVIIVLVCRKRSGAKN